MQTKKMSLGNIQGKLSRAEMKKIMVGSGDAGWCGILGGATCTGTCKIFSGPCQGVYGKCAANSHGCFCAAVC